MLVKARCKLIKTQNSNNGKAITYGYLHYWRRDFPMKPHVRLLISWSICWEELGCNGVGKYSFLGSNMELNILYHNNMKNYSRRSNYNY